jgi:hypothetical protein
MNRLDKIEDYNDLILEIFAEKTRRGHNRDLLIREVFILWYVLIEGIECQNFSSGQIQEYLFQNYNLFQKSFLKDNDYCFIVGWMISVSFWNFDPHGGEKDGYGLLYKVYKNQPRNSLFKWAVSDTLSLNDLEVLQLEGDILLNFSTYYNHGPHIKKYFLDMI